jgi:hypothetical protein
MITRRELWFAFIAGLVGISLDLAPRFNWWPYWLDEPVRSVMSFTLFFLVGLIVSSLLQQENIIRFLKKLDKGEYDWFQRNPLLVNFGIRDEELYEIKSDLVINKGHCYLMENVGIEDYTAIIRKILMQAKNSMYATSIFFPSELKNNHQSYMRAINEMIGNKPHFIAYRIMIYDKKKKRQPYVKTEIEVVTEEVSVPEIKKFIMEANTNFKLRWVEVNNLRDKLTGTKIYGDYAIFDEKIVISFNFDNRELTLFKEKDFIKPFLYIFEDLKNELWTESHNNVLGVPHICEVFLKNAVDLS